MKKHHWLVASGFAISLHAGAFYWAFYPQAESGSLAAGEQGIEFDLGMMGDMGAAQESVVAQAETAPPEPIPELKPEPKPEPIPEPEPEPIPEPIVEPKPVVIPPVEKVEVKQKSVSEAPKPEPKPEPKPKPKPEPKLEPKPVTAPAPAPVAQPQAQVVPQANAQQTVVQQKVSTGSANAQTSGGQVGASTDYYAKLVAKLAQEKRYPKASRRRGEEGIVTIGFEVHPSGEAKNIRVVKSSGSERLDQAALDMVLRAQPLPAFKLDMGTKPLDITLPVAFELN